MLYKLNERPILQNHIVIHTRKCRMNFTNVKAANGRSHQTICARRKCAVKFRLIIWHLINWLHFIEIKRKFTRYTAIDARLQICRPILAENIFATNVLFADTRYSRVHSFAAIYVFDSCFAEKEVHVFANVKRPNKVWLCIEEKKTYLSLFIISWKCVWENKGK